MVVRLVKYDMFTVLLLHGKNNKKKKNKSKNNGE